MEDTTNATMEQEQTSLGPAERASADQPGEWQASDGFLDGWDDEPVSEAADQPAEITEERAAQEPETAPADTREKGDPAKSADFVGRGGRTERCEKSPQGGCEQSRVSSDDAQQEKPPADAPRTWTLRHMDEVRQVSEADMVTLAQKGLDYDRIRSRYDESKPVMEMFGQFAQRAGMSVSDYVAHIRTQAKMSNGMSEAEARRQNVNARQERAGEEHIPMWTKETAGARREADILEFQQRFPAAARDPSAIPPQVWAQVRAGATLTDAYGAYLRDQGQGTMNAARSTGSMRSAGGEFQCRDPFLLGWDSE